MLKGLMSVSPHKVMHLPCFYYLKCIRFGWSPKIKCLYQMQLILIIWLKSGEIYRHSDLKLSMFLKKEVG